MITRLKTRFAYLTLLVILAAQTVSHLAWLPISAHSGQVAIPWMMNRGMRLFDTLIEQHAPGSSLVGALAQQAIPAEPLLAIRFANLLLVLATTVLVYVLAARLSDGRAWVGVAAALVWFWWEPVYGNVMLYFDTLLGFTLLAAVVWVVLAQRGGWLTPLLVGLLLGLATLFKQHGWAAVGIFGLWLLFTRRDSRWRDALAFGAGALVFPVLWLLVMAAQGSLDAYLYWNWGFNFSGLMVNDPLDGDFLRKLLFTWALVPVLLFSLLPSPRATSSAGSGRAVRLLVFLLWLAGCLTLIPRPGEIHVMGGLPLMAVMSGMVIVEILRYLRAQNTDATARALAGGLLVVVGAAWLWTGAAAYARTFTGIPAYDEFTPIAAELQSRAAPGETLFVLPETDSTPQLHPMSGLLPPGTWIKGWFWYLEPPGVVETLLAEWAATPPTYVVIFPDMLTEGEPGITPLVEFVTGRYTQVATYEAIPFHGAAEVWALAG